MNMVGLSAFFLIPVLYAGLKIVAGVLILHYGKDYSQLTIGTIKVKEEQDG